MVQSICDNVFMGIVPAFAIKMSILPNFSTVALTSFSTESYVAGVGFDTEAP